MNTKHLYTGIHKLEYERSKYYTKCLLSDLVR